MADFPYPLVEAAWLIAHQGEADLKVVDGSWRLPGGGDARADHLERRIPGAVFFAIDEIADRDAGLPHMLPSPAKFEAAVGALGISERDRVVVYDDQGVFSAARVWWTFKAMGHEAVSVLNGGLPAYRRTPGAAELSSGAEQPSPCAYRASPNPGRLAGADEVRQALKDGSPVIDARPAGRFEGRDAEPRPGLRRGSMPGATNLPWSTLVGPDGRLLRERELETLLAAHGSSRNDVAIVTCGSGVTAAVLALATETLGWMARLYDGSWAEWGRETNDLAQYPVTRASP